MIRLLINAASLASILLGLHLTSIVVAQIINAPEPVVTQPVAAKTFQHLWISRLRVAAPAVDAGSITIELLPYNAQTKELGPASEMITLTTDKMWQAAHEVPEVGLALKAVLESVEPLRVWIEADKAKAAAAQGQ